MDSDLRRDLERHRPYAEINVHCYECGRPWPCDAARALAALAEKDGIIAVVHGAAEDVLVALTAIRYGIAVSTVLGPAVRDLETVLSDLSQAAKTNWTDKPCLVWTGSRTGGYGMVGRGTLLHRLVWEAANGPIPDGLLACHRCDNPPCYQLSHLFLGTVSDNARDSVSKGRWGNHQYFKLTSEQVREIQATVTPNQSGSRKQGGLSAAARKYGVSTKTIRRALAYRFPEEAPNV
jgi:hypothetical protein